MKIKINYNKIYKLYDDSFSDIVTINPIRPVNAKEVLLTGQSVFSPIAFNHKEGKIYTDIIFGGIALYLFSDKLVQLLNEKKITGWKTYPIKLYGENKELQLGYHGFSVIGRCGKIINEKRKLIKTVINNEEEYHRILYYEFQDDYWDGSDIFCPEETTHIIIAEKVKKIFEENRITNYHVSKILSLKEKWTE